MRGTAVATSERVNMFDGDAGINMLMECNAEHVHQFIVCFADHIERIDNGLQR